MRAPSKERWGLGAIQIVELTFYEVISEMRRA